VLADQTKQDTKKIEEIRRSEVLQAGKIFTISDFTSKPESDIEDLFEIGGPRGVQKEDKTRLGAPWPELWSARRNA
jgi:hypothetical protein